MNTEQDLREVSLARQAVEDALLLRKLEKRLEEASGELFDTAVAAEAERAHAIALRMLGDYEAASAAVHRAFTRAESAFHLYDGRSSVSTWMLRFVADELLRQAAPQPSAEPHGEQHQAHDAHRVLAMLSPHWRIAVVLHDVIGLPEREAASILRVAALTLRRWVGEAHTLLRDRLSPVSVTAA